MTGSEQSRGRVSLLERDGEIDRAAAAIARACAGVGGTLILEGPPGIGKTELLRAVHELASERGMQALRARGDDLESDFPYGVARQLFEPAVNQASKAVRASLLDAAAAPAAAILGAAGSADSSVTALHALFWLTSNLAERAPLLLAVDDAHWADPPSLRFLLYLSRRLSELPVLLVVARRRAHSGASAELVERIAAEIAASVLSLAPLRATAATELVRALLGDDADEEFCAACHAATLGNPLLLRELAVALREAGVAPTRAQAPRVAAMAPEGISRRVLLRLLRLSPEARVLARCAAVLGAGVPLRRAGALAGLDAAGAARAADSLVAADVFGAVHPIEFVHPVVREVIYADIAAGERALTHARAARVLSDSGAPAAQTAVQLLAAEPAGGEPWAIGALRDAAREALRRGEPGGAAVFLERALAEPPASPELQAELLRELGRAKVLAGDPSGSACLRAAMQAMPAGAPRAELASELAHAYIPVGRFVDAVDVLEHAIADLGWYDRELALRLEAEMSTTGRLHPATCARTAKRLELVGSDLAGETPAERMLAVSLATHRTMEGRRPAAAVAAPVQRAWADGLLAEQTSASPMLYDALFVGVVAEAFPFAEQICDEAVADARRRGSLLGITGSLCFRAHLAYRRGSIAAAESDAAASVEAAELGGYAFAPMALAMLVEALRERGELVQAEAVMDAKGYAGKLSPDLMATFLALSRGRLRIAAGDIERGIADLRDVARRDEHVPMPNPGILLWRSSLALALTQIGDSVQARALASEELALARQWGTPRPIGIALRALGLADAGAGDDAGAGLHHVRESVAVLDGSRAPLELARSLVELGAALRRDGARMAARDPLRRALDLASRCGATTLAEQAHVELLASGARPRRLALAGVRSLTPSELRVAQLAADGLGNRAIAQALFISMRTVQVHLTHVYQKLDISGRDELAHVLVTEAAPA